MYEYSSRGWEKLIITFSLSETKCEIGFCDFERIACVKEAFLAARMVTESPRVKEILARRACRWWW